MKRGGPENYAKAYKSLVYLRGSSLLAAKELFYVHCQIDIEKRLLSQSSRDSEAQKLSGNGPNDTLTAPDDASESHSEHNKEHSERADAGTTSDVADSQLEATPTHPHNPEYSVESTNYWKELWRYLKTPSGRAINYWQKLGQLVTERRIRRVLLSSATYYIFYRLLIAA